MITIGGVRVGCKVQEALAILGSDYKKEPILDDNLTTYTFSNSLSLVVSSDDVVREVHGGADLAVNGEPIIHRRMHHDEIVKILGTPISTQTGDYQTLEFDENGDFVPHPLSPGPVELYYRFDTAECRIFFFEGPVAFRFSLRIPPEKP